MIKAAFPKWKRCFYHTKHSITRPKGRISYAKHISFAQANFMRPKGALSFPILLLKSDFHLVA
ncbi:MAG: hypothetical protein IJN21_08265, partial [Clostridia bacterium]|nr:hypothetical protein [Clostridia bacterium]